MQSYNDNILVVTFSYSLIMIFRQNPFLQACVREICHDVKLRSNLCGQLCSELGCLLDGPAGGTAAVPLSTVAFPLPFCPCTIDFIAWSSMGDPSWFSSHLR